MKRFLFITNLPTPYRIDFYNELGKMCKLTVLFEGRRWKAQQFNWKDDKEVNFEGIYLSDTLNESKIHWQVFGYLESSKFDKIVISCYHTRTQSLAILYMKVRNIPYVFETDGGIVKKNETLLQLKIKQSLIGGASCYLSPSKDTDNYLQYYGASLQSIHRYPFSSINSTDIVERPDTSLEKKFFKQKLGIREEIVILGIGQFISRKGFDLLIQASARFPDNTAVVLVGGNPNEYYMKLIDRYKCKHVYFEEFKDKEKLSEYYRASDIFVLPTREDIWGLVINEAMSQGLPVVTTDRCVAGIALLKDLHAIVPSDDVNALQETLLYLLTHKEVRYKMAEHNLQIIRNYTTEQMALSIYQILS